jgi:hypothetical protein
LGDRKRPLPQKPFLSLLEFGGPSTSVNVAARMRWTKLADSLRLQMSPVRPRTVPDFSGFTSTAPSQVKNGEQSPASMGAEYAVAPYFCEVAAMPLHKNGMTLLHPHLRSEMLREKG